jgi:integrase
VEDEKIGRNPARVLKVRNVDPAGGLKVLEAEQVERIAQAHEERFRALVYLLGYHRGLRIGEAAALQVRDFDGMRGSLTIDETLTEVAGRLERGAPKTDAGVRTISLPPFLRDRLTEHLAAYSSPKNPTAPIFTMPGGGPLRPNNYRKRVFEKAAERAGLGQFVKVEDRKTKRWEGPTPHDLRDTAATLMFADRASVKEVQETLGHAKASITLDRYAGVLDSTRARTDDALEARFEAARSSVPQTCPEPAANVIELPAG